MELIGIAIAAAAIIWGAVEMMKHVFPTWSERQDRPVRRYIHERIDGVEEDIDLMKRNMERLINKVESP